MAPNGIEELRGRVEKAIREAVKPEHYETIASGSQTPDEVIFPDRIDASTGYWARGHTSKPPRWLIHIDPAADDGVRVVVPEQDARRRLGQGNTTGGKLPKVCLVFLVVPMARNQEGTYERVENWEWVLYFVLGEPTPKVTSSTGFTAPHLAEGVIKVQQHPLTFVHAGLVELLPRDRATHLAGVKDPVEYGEVSRQLLKVLKHDQAPEG